MAIDEVVEAQFGTSGARERAVLGDGGPMLFFGEPPPGAAPVASVAAGEAAAAVDRLRGATHLAARVHKLGLRLGLGVEEVLDAWEEIASVRPPSPPLDVTTDQLTVYEEATLREAGLLLDTASPSRATSSAASAGVRYATMLANSLTVKAAATRLAVTEGRIRQRLAERTLYGVTTKRNWRLPAFQFGHDGALPGIEQVLPALDPALHPLAVEGFFVRAQPDLVVEDEAVSPRDWLASGGNVASVAELAGDLLRGA